MHAMSTVDLSYEPLIELITSYQAKARTESRAFLAWYLENVYRLEPTAAQDGICDGPDDKGVDGIYVDEINSRLDIFQARLVQREDKTVGDTQIKEFAGTLVQFETPESIQNIRETTKNDELRGLLQHHNVDQLVKDGYVVRGLFVTNALTDPSAYSYIENSGANIVIRDRKHIEDIYVPAGHVAASRHALTFDVFGFDVAEYKVGSARIVVAPLAATELVEMEGIQSGDIFDHNVRQYLGRTSVNKDIDRSVRDAQEHQNFLLYHNGIAIVAESVDTSQKGKITIANYVVVNGCQSVSVFWDRKTELSSDLRILARIIQLDRSSPLMDSITHHSNNQNGIKPRDFQSNSPLQLRLRNEFSEKFGGQVFYQISRGERSSAPQVIENELAARILLAFDLRQPWTSHQTYKLFDDLHSAIFARPEVNAERILALHNVYEVVSDELGELQNELLANYTLTKFFLLFLLREALDTDSLGREFVQNPASFLGAPNGRERLRGCIKEILRDLIVDLNAEVQEREESGNGFDFKRDLKSPSAVANLARDIQSSYLKIVRRKRVSSFSDLWNGSAP